MSTNEIELLRSRVVMARGYKRLTQSELAEQAGIDQSQLSKFENGKLASPSLAMILAMCRALNLRLDDLLEADIEIFTRELAASEPVAPGQILEPRLPERFLSIPDPRNPLDGAIPLGKLEGDVVGIANSELAKNMHLVGRSGSGKSQWLNWAGFSIAKSGYPLVVVDPLGSLCDDLLDSVLTQAPERARDLVVLDFSGDAPQPVAMNPLDVRSEAEVGAAVRAALELICFGEDRHRSAPRSRIYLTQALIALCHANLAVTDEHSKATLFDVPAFFEDMEFRQLVVHHCRDSSIRKAYDIDFGIFERLGENQKLEQSAWIRSTIASMEASELLHRTFNHSSSRVDFKELIRSGAIVLLKLDARRHRLDASALAACLTVMIMEAAMESGSGCRIILDDAPSIIRRGSQIPELLAETRPHDIGLLFSSQSLSSYPDEALDPLVANADSKIAFAQDLKSSRQFAETMPGPDPEALARIISDLPNFAVYGSALFPGASGSLEPDSFLLECLEPLGKAAEADTVDQKERVFERSTGHHGDFNGHRDHQGCLAALARHFQPGLWPDPGGGGEEQSGFEWAEG